MSGIHPSPSANTVAPEAAVVAASPPVVTSQLFIKKIQDRLAPLGDGITAPWWIRADDGLTYAVKDDGATAPHVRVAEFLWSSIARLVHLPAPQPEIIEDPAAGGRLLVASRREHTNIGRDHAACLSHLLSGNINNGGRHLSRIYAFDLFCANWDRHPGNFLILDESGTLVVFAIDFSHVALTPGLSRVDPMAEPMSATRVWFKPVVQPYGHDLPAATEIVDRLEKLPINAIQTVLTAVPQDWLTTIERDQIVNWWDSADRKDRASQLRQGLQNGTYV